MENIAERVTKIVKDSLYKPEEITDKEKPPEGAIVVDGIMRKWGFHPERLLSHKEEVREILNEMPETFHMKGGGGWSFLNLCMDKNNNQWGEHANMDELCVLAIGLKMGKWLMPRDVWEVLPGGMPYVGFET